MPEKRLRDCVNSSGAQCLRDAKVKGDGSRLFDVFRLSVHKYPALENKRTWMIAGFYIWSPWAETQRGDHCLTCGSFKV